MLIFIAFLLTELSFVVMYLLINEAPVIPKTVLPDNTKSNVLNSQINILRMELLAIKDQYSRALIELEQVKNSVKTTSFSVDPAEIKNYFQEINIVNNRILALQEQYASKSIVSQPTEAYLKDIAELKAELAGFGRQVLKIEDVLSLTREKGLAVETKLMAEQQERQKLSDELKSQQANIQQNVSLHWDFKETIDKRFNDESEQRKSLLAQVEKAAIAQAGALNNLESGISDLRRDFERLTLITEGFARDVQPSVEQFDKKIASLHGSIKRHISHHPDGVKINIEPFKKEMADIKKQFAVVVKEVAAFKINSKSFILLNDQKKQRLHLHKELQSLIKMRQDELHGLDIKIRKIQRKLRDALAGQPVVANKAVKAPQIISAPQLVDIQPPESMITRLDRRVCEALVKKGLIAQSQFDEALNCHYKFGERITHYVSSFGYISEENLASFISLQFGVPYYSIGKYVVTPEVIKILPWDIVLQYGAIPLTKRQNIIEVLMANPLDTAAIKELEKMTGCRVQPYLGTTSDILSGIESYYGSSGWKLNQVADKKSSALMDALGYANQNRRQALRLDAAIDFSFNYEGGLRQYKTKNISPSVFLFESQKSFILGSNLDLKINLPRDFYPDPIPVLGQVSREVSLKNGMFDVGVRFTKIDKQSMTTVLEYAKQLVHSKK